jgi:proteasome accessory factor C
MESMATAPTPDLDRAVDKLRAIVDAELSVGVATPPCLAAAQEAWRVGRSLRFRYVRDHDDAATEREIVPYRVYSKWGHWYFQGRELDDTEPKQFRIDRMHDAVLGDVEFDPPPDTEIPDWFDLSQHERTVRLRLAPEQIVALPRNSRHEAVAELPDGRVEVDVTVAGDRRLDYLLVSLDPDVEIVSPVAAQARQREVAARLLSAYSP